MVGCCEPATVARWRAYGQRMVDSNDISSAVPDALGTSEVHEERARFQVHTPQGSWLLVVLDLGEDAIGDRFSVEASPLGNPSARDVATNGGATVRDVLREAARLMRHHLL